MQALHSRQIGPQHAPCFSHNKRQHRQQWQQQHPSPQLLSLRSATSGTCGPALQHTTTQHASWGHSHLPLQPHRLSIIAAAGNNQQQTSQQQQQKDAAEHQQQQQQQQQQSQIDDSSSKVDPAEVHEDEDEGEWDSDDEYEDLGEGDEGEWEEGWEDEESEEEEDDGSFLTPTARQIPDSQKTVNFTQDDFVEVGLISRPHGVRGEVKVQLITDEPKKRLGTAGKRLWLQALPVRSGLVPPSAAAARQGEGSDPFKTLRRVVVQSGRVARPGGKGQREEWAVKFEGYDSREKAADLAGHKLLLALCDREAHPGRRDEFFIDQLVGLKAVDASSNILVGIVTEVYENGASYSLLRMRLAPEEPDIAESKYRSVLVPFVSEIVPTVDVAGGQLGLSLPEGLLETASVTKLRKAYTPEQQAQLREQLKKRQQQQMEWQPATEQQQQQ